MKVFSILSILALLSSFMLTNAADGTCVSEATLFECPSEECGGIIMVTDCFECDGFLSGDIDTGVCFDRKLLNGKENPPGYLWRDIVGMLIWFLTAGVATAAGVGGGGIYVPLGILLLSFSPKPSSGLSQASIFGASVGGLILNIRNNHPFTTKYNKRNSTYESHEMDAPEDTDNEKYYTRPLIDFDMALFLAPMEMAGAVLGVIIQKLLPNWLYLGLAAIILGFTAYKTFSKYFDTRRKEIAKREAAQTAAAEEKQNEPQEDDDENVAADNKTLDDSEGADDKEEVADTGARARCLELLERDSRQFPADKVIGLLLLWIGLIVITFFKGGKGVESLVGITCASPWYGVLIGIQFLWTLGISLFYAMKLVKNTEEKKRVGYPFHPQDVLWDATKARFYAFFTFIAGIVAGLIGIGGGMVLGPLMLVMGIHPRVSSATTATMVVLTSSSVAVLFVTSGLVPWQYAVAFFSVCLVGAFIGKKYIDGYVKKTGKASTLIFVLAVIIALATIGCLYTMLSRLADKDWCLDGFNEFCTIKEDSDEDMCAAVVPSLRL